MENKKVDQAILKLSTTIKQVKSDGACQGAAVQEMNRIKDNFSEVLTMTADRPAINDKMVNTALNTSDLLQEVSDDLQSRKCTHNEAHQKLHTLRTKLEEKKKLFIHME